MEFWNNKVNVSEEAAALQISIVSNFPSEKRMKIALDISNFCIDQTRNWISKNHPSFSDLEISLEFVRLMYYEKGEISQGHWDFYKSKMKEKIRADWAIRFRAMMDDNNLTYDDVALLGNFKSGKVVEATISRRLPAFAKLSVVMHELRKSNRKQINEK